MFFPDCCILYGIFLELKMTKRNRYNKHTYSHQLECQQLELGPQLLGITVFDVWFEVQKTMESYIQNIPKYIIRITMYIKIYVYIYIYLYIQILTSIHTDINTYAQMIARYYIRKHFLGEVKHLGDAFVTPETRLWMSAGPCSIGPATAWLSPLGRISPSFERLLVGGPVWKDT